MEYIYSKQETKEGEGIKMENKNKMFKEKFYVRRRVKTHPSKNQYSAPPGMKIILEFPPPSQNDEKVKQEVHFIMSTALQEQLQKK